ncbi:hypothetical protein Pint_31568 [Pistacia integerrima]|uniref:Uncharacterized protein n=1 Tax=Pistacia integerrima TaxID=434235 RepID=A0ACC0XS99_9ROSI|nr:hypothetical protein Pint_31568 [Pistacia integerrima]
MYKTKLQELCHEKRWRLPSYSSMKDGPDHNPRFKSSVSVNGLSFHSSVSSKSYKHSQNDAAMLAYLHFTTSPSVEPSVGEPEIGETFKGPEIYLQVSPDKNDVQCQYKSRLQNYARCKILESPVYYNITEGPAHAPRFKATVTVDGHTFESLEFFTNLKQAEHAAAKVALTSLSFDGFQEEDYGFYKNLLQEFCQREDLSMPEYKTKKSGASHMPTFFCTVDVEGEVFYGKAGKSKKVAEIKAAKVAYTALIESGQSQRNGLSSPTIEVDRASKSTCISDLAVTVDSENLQEKSSVSSSLVAKYAYNSEGKAALMKSIPCMDDTLSSFHMPTSPEGCSFPSPPMTMTQLPDVSSLSISNSSVGTPTETRSYLLCNRVRVYTCIPEIIFPNGITLLPISNNQWVAVSLEFPNETN